MNKCQDPRYTIAEATQYWLELNLPTEDYADDVIANINIILNQRIVKAVSDPMLAANLLHPEYQGLLLTPAQTQKAKHFLSRELNERQNEELRYYFQYKNERYARLHEKCRTAMEYWTICSLTLTNLL